MIFYFENNSKTLFLYRNESYKNKKTIYLIE